MFQKTTFIFCLTILFLIGSVSADTASELEQAKAIVKSYIASGKLAEAEEAYQKFVTAFADNPLLPPAVYDIAETYRNHSKFGQSLQIYNDVVTKWPNSSQAVWAQRGLAVSNIALDKLSVAQTELDKLKTSFSADPNIAEAVFNVADAYYWFNKFAEADAVYKYVAAGYPDKDWAMWAQMGLAISSIAQEKDAEAEAATQRLLTDYAGNAKLSEALFYIAGRYEYSKKYEKAKSIYSQIASQFPASSQAVEVPFAVAKIDVLAGIESEDADALSAIDGLVAKFSSRQDLPGVLSGPIAERLYDKAFKMETDSGGQRRAYFQKTVEIWEMVSKQSPNLTNTADGYSWAGHCYRELGQYEKAIQCYQKVVDNFPDHRLAWNDLFLIGRCNEDMKKTGLISASEANLNIRAAYQHLLEKYPDCKVAGIAQNWLNKNGDNKVLFPFLRSE